MLGTITVAMFWKADGDGKHFLPGLVLCAYQVSKRVHSEKLGKIGILGEKCY